MNQSINHKVFLFRKKRRGFSSATRWHFLLRLFYWFNVGQWRDTQRFNEAVRQNLERCSMGWKVGRVSWWWKNVALHDFVYTKRFVSYLLCLQPFLWWPRCHLRPWPSSSPSPSATGSRPRSALPSNLSMTRSIIQIDYSLKFLLCGVAVELKLRHHRPSTC